jgi:histidine triad (HIT) family protein
MPLQQQLSDLTDGLFYMSESDYPIKIVKLKPEHTIAALLPEDVLRALEPKATVWQNRTPAELLAHMCRIEDWMTEEERIIGQRFRDLVAFCEQTCEQVAAYKVGSIKVECYIIGKTRDNEWFALKTIAVET